MKNDRLRCPVKPDYVEALGCFTYTFASLEWQVVSCVRKIHPNSSRKIIDEKMTAGQIAKKFIDVARNMPRSPEREKLELLARQFMDLVDVRNHIVHGKPCTGPNGESRLSGNDFIEIPDLENAADDFIECSVKLNGLFYGFLQAYEPIS